MSKKLLLSATVLFLLAGASFASAADKAFKDFTIDVPSECQGTEKESSVTIACPENTFFSLSIKSVGAAKGKPLAEETAKQMGGSTPTLNDFGNYTFDATRDGFATKVELIEQNGMLMVYTTDNTGDWPEYLGKAFDSIRGNTPEIEDFVQRYLLQ